MPLYVIVSLLLNFVNHIYDGPFLESPLQIDLTSDALCLLCGPWLEEDIARTGD